MIYYCFFILLYFSFVIFFFFFFNDTATTEIYTLSLHDALPTFSLPALTAIVAGTAPSSRMIFSTASAVSARSEEHTSELQSHLNLVCRLLLEKKKAECARVRLVIEEAPLQPRLRADRPEPGSFFFNETATTEIYTLSLHDALPICASAVSA